MPIVVDVADEAVERSGERAPEGDIRGLSNAPEQPEHFPSASRAGGQGGRTFKGVKCASDGVPACSAPGQLRAADHAEVKEVTTASRR